jgi:predicted lipid-binding transport protein (Tim44 family)
MLGGLAAGLGLAWLASALGFGEAFAQFLLFALLAVVVLASWAWSCAAAQPVARQGGWPFQGAAPSGAQAAHRLPSPPQLQPAERGQRRIRPALGAQRACTFGPGQGARAAMIGSALAGPQTWGIPAGFDTEGFLRAQGAIL